jgi:small conductance mechanosensitive channel
MEIKIMESQISTIQRLIDKLIEFCVNYSFQIIGAIIILIVGFYIAKWVASLIMKLCEKKKLDVTLTMFLASLVKIIIIVFVVVLALGKFGITVTPFVAAIGALVFGATYAIHGPLSNYAGGIAIILGRPFVVGDTISVQGVNGVVQAVKLANTTLLTEDSVKVTIPNRHIVGEILWSSKKQRIIEASVGISYSDDPEKAISVISETLQAVADVVNEPAPQIGIEEFGDSSINIAYRYWVPSGKYFQTKYAVNLGVYKALKKSNITIPFPQRDVNIKKS